MKEERTNSIQIIKYILIDHIRKNPLDTNKININYSSIIKNNNADMIIKEIMESSKKYQEDIDKLIEKSNKEFNVEKTIKEYKENIEKENKEMNKRMLLREERNNKFIQEMLIPNDYIRKRQEEIQKNVKKREEELEARANRELEILRIEKQKMEEKWEKKRLEEEKKNREEIEMQRKFYEEIEQKEKEKQEMQLRFLEEKEQLMKEKFKVEQKISNDLTEETKKYLQMKKNYYDVEKQNKLLLLDNDKLKSINEINQEHIRQLNNQNNNRRNNISYTLNYNNYYRNDNQNDNMNVSQPFPNNFNNF